MQNHELAKLEEKMSADGLEPDEESK